MRRPDYHNYNCHMAVLQWACLALNQSQDDALWSVELITRSVCEHCKGRHDARSSIDNAEYGRLFCSDAVALIPTSARAGDVVIIPDPRYPTHSMVVVSSTRGEIMVRGYNNAGTFVGTPRDAYDPSSRNLAGRTLPQVNRVFLIPELEFLGKVRALQQALRLRGPNGPIPRL
jgi:hypothetical protein